PSVRRAMGLGRTTRALRADGETGVHTHRQGGSRIRVAVMLVLGALLAGGPTEPAEAKDQWVVAVPEEAESLDPQASALFTSEVYQQHIFDPLVGIGGGDLKPVGLRAEGGGMSS